MFRLPALRSHLAVPVIVLTAAFVAVGCTTGRHCLPALARRQPSPGDTPVVLGGSPSAEPSVLPVIVSSQQVVGQNRFVFSFLDASIDALNELLAE